MKILRYKLYHVPREAIDEGSDEPDALLLHGIDNGAVRRVDVLIDSAYGRKLDAEDKQIVNDALRIAPAEAWDLIVQ